MSILSGKVTITAGAGASLIVQVGGNASPVSFGGTKVAPQLTIDFILG